MAFPFNPCPLAFLPQAPGSPREPPLPASPSWYLTTRTPELPPNRRRLTPPHPHPLLSLVEREAPPRRRFLPLWRQLEGARDVRAARKEEEEEGKRTGTKRRAGWAAGWGGGGAPPRWRTRSRCTRCRAAPSGERPITPAPPRRRGTTGTGVGAAWRGAAVPPPPPNPLKPPHPPHLLRAGGAVCAPRPAPLPLRGSRTQPGRSAGRGDGPPCRPRSGVVGSPCLGPGLRRPGLLPRTPVRSPAGLWWWWRRVVVPQGPEALPLPAPRVRPWLPPPPTPGGRLQLLAARVPCQQFTYEQGARLGWLNGL